MSNPGHSKRVTVSIGKVEQEAISRTMETYGFQTISQAIAFMVASYWSESDAKVQYSVQFDELLALMKSSR